MLKHQSLSATHLWNPTFCIRLLASRFCHRDIKQPKPPHCTAEASKCVQVEGLGNPKKVEFHAGERIFTDQCLYWRYIPISVCTGKVEIYSPIFACTGNIYSNLCRPAVQPHMRGEPDAGDGRVLRQCVLLLLVTFLGANKYVPGKLKKKQLLCPPI